MLEKIRKIINEKNNDNRFENISFDFRLMLFYHIAMMALFVLRIFDNAKNQAMLALMIGIVLVIISIAHKIRGKWKWPGLNVFSIPSALLNVVVVYIFFVYAAYTIGPGVDAMSFDDPHYTDLLIESWSIIIKSASISVLTPWYLAGIGIGVFNFLSALRLTTTKKSEFEAQCMKS